MRRSALAACIVSAVLLAGCGQEEGPPIAIDWDLARSHTAADVGWPDPSISANELRPIRTLRIRLSGGREIAERGGIHAVYIEALGVVHPATVTGRTRVSAVSVHSEALSTAGALALARRWSREFRLPTDGIDEWEAGAGRTYAIQASTHIEVFDPEQELGPNRPAVSISVRDSAEDPEDGRPLFVILSLDWLSDEKPDEPPRHPDADRGSRPPA